MALIFRVQESDFVHQIFILTSRLSIQVVKGVSVDLVLEQACLVQIVLDQVAHMAVWAVKASHTRQILKTHARN